MKALIAAVALVSIVGAVPSALADETTSAHAVYKAGTSLNESIQECITYVDEAGATRHPMRDAAYAVCQSLRSKATLYVDVASKHAALYPSKRARAVVQSARQLEQKTNFLTF